MLTVKKQDGNTIRFYSSNAVKAGDIVVSNRLIGVALSDFPAGSYCTLALTGSYLMPKATGEALTVGSVVFWDSTNKEVTVKAGGNHVLGYAVSAAGASADKVEVRLIDTGCDGRFETTLEADGTETEFEVEHNLGTFVDVKVYDTTVSSGAIANLAPSAIAYEEGTVTLTFASAPTATTHIYTVVVRE